MKIVIINYDFSFAFFIKTTCILDLFLEKYIFVNQNEHGF
jgi:hypothetical protein